MGEILRMVTRNITRNRESDKVCSDCDRDKEVIEMNGVQLDRFDIEVRPSQLYDLTYRKRKQENHLKTTRKTRKIVVNQERRKIPYNTMEIHRSPPKFSA